MMFTGTRHDEMVCIVRLEAVLTLDDDDTRTRYLLGYHCWLMIWKLLGRYV